MLTKLQVLILGFLAILALLFIAFGFWWWFIRNPIPANGTSCKATDPNTICLYNGNIAAIEKVLSTSIPTPTMSLTLKDFDYSIGYAPWCIPSFYAFRYVDSEGNYGPLSDWYGPVVASSDSSPGKCNANIPFLQVQDLTDPGLTRYYANVHRQDGTLDTNSEGSIVGSLYKEIYTFIDDPATGPNSDYSVFPCSGC
jgi:hypothetical protein